MFMVYIKSLICEGFKSFKQRTKVNFSKGFTSIVGANGSGKSNILDAFVFALGELSGNKLRVNNIKDLICNGGSAGGKPSKTARVDVVFDNSDRKIPLNDDIITISREINFEGQGKYYINDKTTTRRDLQDIMELAGLIPNSSNLILQGELFRIINMNNNERRGLIEEISGIAFYNEKKENAEKDLKKVEEDISRITLILNEVSLQLESLEKEKADALKYLEHDTRQKKAEQSIVVLKVREIEKQMASITEKKGELVKEINEINSKLVSKRENLAKITAEIDVVKDEIQKLQSSELKELTFNLNNLKTERTKKETQKENGAREIDSLKKHLISAFKKKESVELEKAELQEKLTVKKEEKTKLKISLESLKEELGHCEEHVKSFNSEYATYQKELETVVQEISKKKDLRNEKNSEVKVLDNKIENQKNVLSSIVSKANKIKKEKEDIEVKIKALEEHETEANDSFDAESVVAQLEKEKDELSIKQKELRELINEKREELISLKSKIKVVQKFSGNKALEEILKIKGNPADMEKHQIHGKIHGSIAQLGKTSQKYNIALQAAAGGKFNFIVVDAQSTATQCINYLKKNKIGRASFIPLDKITGNAFDLKNVASDKIIGKAVDLIEFDPKFSKAFDFVFGRTIVVDDIETASKLNLNARKVTLDGDIVESSNLMTGGKAYVPDQVGFGALEEAKIPPLEAEISELTGRENSYIKKFKEIEAKISESYKKKISMNSEKSKIKQDLAVLRDNAQKRESQIKDLDSDKIKTEGEFEQLESILGVEKKKLSELDAVLSCLKSKEQELKKKMSLLKENDFAKKINVLEVEINKADKLNVKLKLEITKLETQINEIANNRELDLEKDILDSQERLKLNVSDLENATKSLVTLNEQIHDLEVKFSERNEVIGQYYKKENDLFKEQTTIKLGIEDLKSSIHPRNLKINTLEINLNNYKTQKAEFEKILLISENLLKELTEFLSYTQEKLLQIANESAIIKKQLEPVNMRAIKKFDKIKSRYDDLIQKHDIVVKERQIILGFIQKIEVEKKNAFMNAFNGINDRFKDIFAKLSPGGESKLELENIEDPFAGGVKMMARPGEKKWCLTQSMSGGEKTLTVIALILGIQMYIPSPYYILDEIDAALDDNNANQVASMIKDLSEESQFILITHRDVTMTKTDHLLGVSNVNGLTAVLNLNIQEALAQIVQEK